MHKILVIGAVRSTAITLLKLIEHRFEIVGVLGHEPLNPSKVSGWADLSSIAIANEIDYQGFSAINDEKNIEWAIKKRPDIIFAVGFSQLLNDQWLKLPKLGCIGFHPTHLPQGRGRAPLAWIILDQLKGSATFFLMGKGADDGPIFTQSLFDVEEKDDATSVEEKIKTHIGIALDSWLPDLKNGVWNPIAQDDNLASWYGRRGPQDGWINWNDNAQFLDKLIKASTRPHPGAYTYFKDSKLTVWQSQVETEVNIKGVIGRVLLVDEVKGWLIQCGVGLLWIKNLDSKKGNPLRVGDKLGYNIEDEIYNIKKNMKNV